MRQVVAKAIACGILLLVLPSCGIPPLRDPAPGPGLPGDFKGATNPENSSQLSIEEFYNDPMLTCLIQKGMLDNRELRVLNEEVAIASNEVLARSGQYLPFVSATAGAGLERASRFTEVGAGLIDDQFLPGKLFSNPHANYLGGINYTWQLDIYRQLRNARDAAGQRYNVAIERRNYFVTTLVADIAENYYRLMALDKRLENLNQIIEFLQQSLGIAERRVEAARDTRFYVLRFQAELQRNQSELLIVNQDIIVTENRINFLVNRYPQPVVRVSDGFYDLNLHALSLGVPSQLVENRPDIRQAERELAASGLDVKVARVNFFPQLVLSGGVGLEAFNLRYLFEPQAVVGQVAGGLVAPLVNKRAIRAQYLTANARQLQALYNYQRVILEAFTQVINRISMVENYTRSIEIKKKQLESLQASVDVANSLFLNARLEYIDVLLAQRDLRDARTILIDTKLEQLTAIADTYQALGGGLLSNGAGGVFQGFNPYIHTVRDGESFRSIAETYYKSGGYSKALWAANKKAVPAPDRLTVGDKIIIPRVDQLDPALVEEVPTTAPPVPGTVPVAEPAILPPPLPPPAANAPGPFGQNGIKDPAVKATGAKPPSASPTPGWTGE